MLHIFGSQYDDYYSRLLELDNLENMGFEGHRERMRARALKYGMDDLKLYEMFELLLCYAMPRSDTQQLARDLVKEMGGATAVFRATPEALMKVPGMTKPMVNWVLMVAELMHAYLDACDVPRMHINCMAELLRFLVPRWRREPPPQTWIVFTDFEDLLITHNVICRSLYWQDARYVREIVGEAMALHARHAFIVMLMGTEPLELDPSELDYMVAFARTLRAVDVELLDCVLAGEAGIVSLFLEGALDRVREESAMPDLYERYIEGAAEAVAEAIDQGKAPAGSAAPAEGFYEPYR